MGSCAMLGAMADLKVRNLDDRVAASLRVRAKRHGVSLEEEARRVLSSSVVLRRGAVVRRAAALRAAAGSPPKDAGLDSVRIIRQERDAWG